MIMCFYDFSNYISYFLAKEPAISPFFDNNSFIRKLNKNLLVGARKKFEGAQHAEIHLFGLKAQNEGKIKFVIESEHALL